MWALQDCGFRAVISPRFADIFRNNCTKVGLVPVQVEPEVGEALMAAVEADPDLVVTVDVECAHGLGRARPASRRRSPSTTSPRCACSRASTTSASPFATLPRSTPSRPTRPTWLPTTA